MLLKVAMSAMVGVPTGLQLLFPLKAPVVRFVQVYVVARAGVTTVMSATKPASTSPSLSRARSH